MNTIPHQHIIGIDVSRDRLDIHCLPENEQLQIPNTESGHARLIKLAQRNSFWSLIGHHPHLTTVALRTNSER